MNNSQASAYIIGFIAFFVLILISAIVANLIAYAPDGSDRRKRKVAFWILGGLVPVATFAAGYFMYYQNIRVPSRAEAYMTALSISSAAFFVAYIVVGVVLAKIFNHGKLSSWF
ncbi:MAG: hypothetical protein IJT75_05810 [Bacteroidaceae bacterium]|nr:hypothetical protein [Bacteroidaceae bacterium]